MTTGMVFARGSRAWGMCARSGRKMLLRDMVTDPLTELLVDPEWAEPPLMRPPADLVDGIALERPAPDADQIETIIVVGGIVDLATGEPMRDLAAQFELGFTVVGAAVLLTEDGFVILTEDGENILL